MYLPSMLVSHIRSHNPPMFLTSHLYIKLSPYILYQDSTSNLRLFSRVNIFSLLNATFYSLTNCPLLHIMSNLTSFYNNYSHESCYITHTYLYILTSYLFLLYDLQLIFFFSCGYTTEVSSYSSYSISLTSPEVLTRLLMFSRP